jgi:hypothetical protein
MGVFFSVQERMGRNKQHRMPIFLPEFQPSVAVSLNLYVNNFLYRRFSVIF